MGDTAPDACEGCADLGVCRGACDAVLHPTDAAPAGDAAALVAEARGQARYLALVAPQASYRYAALADALERAEGERALLAEGNAAEFAARGRAEALLEYAREARQLAEGRAASLLDEQQRAVREREAALARVAALEGVVKAAQDFVSELCSATVEERMEENERLALGALRDKLAALDAAPAVPPEATVPGRTACAWCGRIASIGDGDAVTVVARRDVGLCDRCVDVAARIVADQRAKAAPAREDSGATAERARCVAACRGVEEAWRSAVRPGGAPVTAHDLAAHNRAEGALQCAETLERLSPAPAREADSVPRPTGCRCDREEGDRLCPVHRGLRWERLDRTTPSGKTLFRCTHCGRESPTPDKTCPAAGCGVLPPEAR